MKTRVVMSARLSDEIPVDNGVKQGHVLASTLFLIFFSVMLIHIFQHCEWNVLLEFRTTGRIFDLQKFNFKSKTFHTLIREFFYADYIDFLAHFVNEILHMVDLFAASSSAFGFKN